MKFNINKIAWLGLSCLMLLATFTLLQSCQEEEEATKWVDLRYKFAGETPYVFAAKDAAPQELYVKSTDAWEVFGTQDWYTISPDKGGAGEKYTVTITCKDNNDLDDRIDTINIKSDYWTGKRFAIIQKGTAYLRTSTLEEIVKEGDTKTITVEANQKWTAKVTEGEAWLTIEQGATGEMNGTITVKAVANKGEKRTGKVSLYDRHGVELTDVAVTCVQNGVTLSPAVPENGKWFALQAEAQKLTIPVDADVEWTVKKADEEDEWYTINGAETTQRQLVIDVTQNKGQQVRTTIVILTSKAEIGAEPVVKEVKIKQINLEYSIFKDVKKTINSSSTYTEGNLSYGTYIIYVTQPLDAADFGMTLQWSWGTGTADISNVQYHIRNHIAKPQTSPWNNTLNMGLADTSPYYQTLTDAPHSLGFRLEPGTACDDAGNLTGGNIIWYVDGVEKANFSKVKSKFNPANLWHELTEPIATLTLNCAGAGSVYVEKYEFIPALDWGE